MPSPIKVAIVEDDSRVRESLAILINGTTDFRCIATYGDAESALRGLPTDWPDVVLMDINLPKMSGIQCVAKLKGMKPALQVVMLTAYEDDEQIFESLMSGASGYLVKRTPPAEIIEALADVQRGGAPMSNTIARKVVHYFQKKRAAADSTADLSKREVEILTHLAKGYQYKEIGALLSISAETVRSHLRNIYEKLHVSTRTEAVVKFLGRS